MSALITSLGNNYGQESGSIADSNGMYRMQGTQLFN